MAKYVDELSAAKRLTELLELPIISPSSPNSPGVETGVDVQFLLGTRKIGVQATVYHADEGQEPGQRGSPLRSEEMAKAREAMTRDGLKCYGHWATASYGPPLQRRVQDKISKALARVFDFDELWLLVEAQVPNWGGTSSTMISPAVVRLEELDRLTDGMLTNSPFSKAFLLIHLDGVVYGWEREKRWQLAKDKSSAAYVDQKEIQDIVFRRGDARERWLSDPQGMEDAAIRDVIAEYSKAT
jgi:hypothetical protein